MRLETLAIHAGYKPDTDGKCAAVPIYQTTSYAFDSARHGADLFNLKAAGNIYTRITNPTNSVLETRMAMLEGGVAAVAVASGMTAVQYSVCTLAKAGDNILAASTLYGGSFTLFKHTLPAMGITAKLFDPKHPEKIKELVDERTKAVYLETIGNPSINVLDVSKFAKYAHEAGIPVIADNTVATPALHRPIEHGADIVIHSLTKYIGGHGTSMGGIVIDSGKFDWVKNAQRFPQFTSPEGCYHGVIMADEFGKAAYAGRLRLVYLRNTGGAASPFNSWLHLQGLESLAPRMERHSANALKIAQFLESRKDVQWVNYPGLPSSPYKPLIDAKYSGKASGLLSFGVKGGRDNGAKFLDALQLFTRLVNIGDAKSLATHPASTTHGQLDAQGLKEAGVPEEMIRLSIGLEHPDDLIDDLSQALDASQR